MIPDRDPKLFRLMEEKKKLYLVKDGKKICGLCNGIGEYFEIDPTIIRLAWLIFACFAGAGILAYIIGAFIVPAKPTYKRIED